MSETKRRPRAATLAACALCLLALRLLAPHAATAQWTTSGTNTTTTNNVGVGTSATPEQKLQVSGGDIGIDNNTALTMKDTSGQFRARFTFTTANNLQVHNFTSLGPGGSIQLLNGNDTGLIQFFTSSSYSERMRITAGGNIGIGTTGPAEKLHVGGGLVVSGPSTQSAGVNGLFLGFTGGTTATIDAVQQGTDYRNLSMSSKTFSVKTWNGSALVQGLYQANTGNVGIGTTDPTLGSAVDSKFTVVNSTTAIAAAYSAAQLSFALNPQSNGSWTMYDRAASAGGAWTAGITQTSGRVGIGTATPGAAYKLDVAGSVNASGLCLGGACKASWSEVGASQWQGGAGGSGPVYYSGGSVGVGTASPIRGLHVAGANGTVGSEFILENTSMPANGRKLNLWGDSTAGTAGRFFLRLLNDAGSAATRDFLSFDNATGQVGVGTPGPTSRLHVDGQPDNLFRVNSTGSGATDTVANFSSAVGNILIVRANGRVGIGVDPTQKLDVAGSVKATGFCLGTVCKSDWSEVGGAASQWQGSAGGPIYYSTGNVGVGTATPVSALEVARVSAGNFRGLHIYNAAGSPYSPADSVSLSLGRSNTHVMGQVTASNTQTGTFGDGYLAFSTRQTEVVYERMRIDNAGRVGIGTTTPGAGLTDPTVMLDVQGSINVSGNISAKFQDVAEWVPSTQKLTAGTVVVLDMGKTNHVVASSSSYDTKVAGVVSAEPGLILGTGGEGKLKVATTGRVKVKVDASRGAIKVGDLLVTSGAEGMAMKSVPVDLGGTPIHRPGTIIGKALEPLASGVGEILVLLSLQ